MEVPQRAVWTKALGKERAAAKAEGRCQEAQASQGKENLGPHVSRFGLGRHTGTHAPEHRSTPGSLSLPEPVGTSCTHAAVLVRAIRRCSLLDKAMSVWKCGRAQQAVRCCVMHRHGHSALLCKLSSVWNTVGCIGMHGLAGCCNTIGIYEVESECFAQMCRCAAGRRRQWLRVMVSAKRCREAS